ncbi:MAG: hypothetical protein J6D44_18195, partial [Pseudomonas sp.]|nr:hypothetical protein [Pseudomonas sp.]
GGLLQVSGCSTEGSIVAVPLVQVRCDYISNYSGDSQRTDCSGLMKPDTLLGENARQIEVSDDQTTPYLFR